MSTRTLFWEDEVPGKTQLMAAIVSSEWVKNVMYYVIELRVSSSFENGKTEMRMWQVKRRYSEFLALHTALSELGFPCPSLPPKQLWGGHTHAFLADRLSALNCWIQGVVVIWQSVAPSRPRVAYAIGELLEAFLCSPDIETFNKTLEDVHNEEKTATDHEDGDIDSQLNQLASASISTVPVPQSPFISHVAAAEKPRSSSSAVQTQPKSTTTYAQISQNQRRSKRKSGTSNSIAEDHSASFSDLPSLQQRKTESPIFDDSKDNAISRSVPPKPASDLLAGSLVGSVPNFLADLAPPKVPSAGAVGIAVDMVPSSSPSAQTQVAEYVTFNNYGQRVKHSFAPFFAKVIFGDGPEGREEVARTSGIVDACTPVSVPPTPHAQIQFTQQWNQYTSSVLEFVQERLSIVSRNSEQRNFNILDRYYPGTENPAHNVSDNEDDDHAHSPGHGHAKPLTVINLRDPGTEYIAEDVPVEDADAGAGGSAKGEALPPKHALAASYVMAGDHLINTILKEAEADITDWQFVSNTKDVVIMRRLRPIKKKNLLKIRGPSVQQPSPSPLIGEDRLSSRGALSAAPPPALTLDGSAAIASMQSPQLGDMEQSQHCFMGRGIINAPAEEIFELVRRPEKRHFYDQMLNEEILLENLAVGELAPDFATSGIGNLLVYYHLFETNRCFLRYVRDFCVMQYAKKVKVGNQVKYVVVGASINHPRCPGREDVERATLDLFGWVVEPTDRPKQSKVTYMLHIDFGPSGVPTHLLNTISFRQPLAVYYLRKHIQSMPAELRAETGKKAESEAAKAEEIKARSSVGAV